MNLAQLLEPLSAEALRESYFGRRAWLKVPRRDQPPDGLLSLEALEARLNDGCATLANLAIIDARGVKLRRDVVYQRQQSGAAWTPEFVRKRLLEERLRAGCTVVLHNMTHISPAMGRLAAEIEAAFEGHQADVHVYVSAVANSSGFQAHCDIPQHKLYLQLFGSTDWTVFRGKHEQRALTPAQADAHLEVDFRATLRPGSVLYLPPGVFHRVTNPSGPRVSISIPFCPADGAARVDRHHVPLRAILTGDADHSST